MIRHDIINLGINKTKKMAKQKGQIRRLLGARTIAAAVVLAALAGGAVIVHADSIQQQIDSLNAQNSQNQQSVNDLQLQATSYQDAINKLQAQIDAIQGALQASIAQQAKLEQQITDDKAKIAVQKSYLSDDIRTMYVDGQLSTIEELATSKNLSDYVDKEEYRTSLQNNINATIKQISVLEEQLQGEKEQVDQLINTQKQQQAKLDSDKQQQDQLLGYNQSQQDSYNSQIKSNNSKISALEAEQARINAENSTTLHVAASGGSGGACDIGYGNGGYPMPWCNAYQDSVTTSGGFPNRECTSFGYWYFTSVEGNSLYVTGNAKDWIYTANRPVDQTPATGSIAVSTAGPYGHIMIVAATSGQSYGGITAPAGYIITISMNDDYNGHFYVRERLASTLYYIH